MKVTWYHSDHSLTEVHKQIAEVLLSTRESGLYVITVDVSNVGWLDNALYGPICGDAPIEDGIFYHQRSADRCPDRMIHRPFRKSRLMTVVGVVTPGISIAEVVTPGVSIADEKVITIYTAHGGPPAKRNPFDTSLITDRDIVESVRFWSIHALACGGCKDCPDAEVL